MAPPSSKRILMASLLVAFFILHPSAAIRVDGDPEGAAGKSSHVVAAPAPAPRGAPVQLKWFLTPDFPCFPFLPQLLLDICHALFLPPTPSPPSPPAPTECRSSLKKKLVPSCTGFLLTDDDSRASAPSRSSDCCEGVHSFYSDESTTPFCLCHVANGDIGELLPAPMKNQTRAVDILVACDIGFTAGQITGICDKDSTTYRDMVPPMDPPSSPSPPPEKKA